MKTAIFQSAVCVLAACLMTSSPPVFAQDVSGLQATHEVVAVETDADNRIWVTINLTLANTGDQALKGLSLRTMPSGIWTPDEVLAGKPVEDLPANSATTLSWSLETTGAQSVDDLQFDDISLAGEAVGDVDETFGFPLESLRRVP